MAETSQTFERLMKAAEDRIRSDGYHAMSFRELADDLGIKSSSVHYYFRRKEDLAVALVGRYSDMFFSELEKNAASAQTGTERVRAICGLYRDAFTQSERVCLCGVLGAEKGGLPVDVSNAVGRFLSKNVDWVKSALPTNTSLEHQQARAEHIIASLQGALILAKNLSGVEVFDRIVDDILDHI